MLKRSLLIFHHLLICNFDEIRWEITKFRTAHRNFTPKDVFNEELLENDTITDITRDKQ